MRLLRDMLYPDDIKCIVCGDDLPIKNREMLCPRCTLSKNDTFCIGCGRAIDTAGVFCDDCHNKTRNFLEARAPLVYEKSVKDVIRRLKYGNGRYLVPVFASLMVDTFLAWRIAVDCVTFVPMHAKRQARRGYNQAELLADRIGETVGLPVCGLLEKTKFTKNLARMNAARRAETIADTFRYASDAKPKAVLLVDDVFTTGATADECAEVLRKGGVKKIYVLTLATARMKQKLY